MNKKEIAEIKRQFKVDNKKVHMGKLISAYVTKEHKILSVCTQEYEQMEGMQQELFLGNFKKSLTGKLGTLLHELEFDIVDAAPNETQLFLNDLFREYNKEKVLALIERIATCYTFEGDYVINILYAQYQKPPKKKKGEEPEIFSMYRYVMCTINPINPPTKVVYFNPQENEVGVTPNILKEIGLKTPIDGFLFPAYDDYAENVNNVLYYTNDKEGVNTDFITQVLGCKVPLTTLQEQLGFTNLLSAFLTETDGVIVVDQVYKELNQIMETQGNDATIGPDELTDIFQKCGAEVMRDEVHDTYNKLIGTNTLTIENIAPKGKVQIVGTNLNVKIPQEILEHITFITDESGKQNLVVAIDTNGITLDDIHINPIITKG